VKEAGKLYLPAIQSSASLQGQPDSKQHLSRIWWHSRLRGLPQSLERRPTAAAAFALDPSITVRDSEVTNVTAAPAIAPRELRQTLRMTAALLS
jgi:hypothetical protein